MCALVRHTVGTDVGKHKIKQTHYSCGPRLLPRIQQSCVLFLGGERKVSLFLVSCAVNLSLFLFLSKTFCRPIMLVWAVVYVLYCTVYRHYK